MLKIIVQKYRAPEEKYATEKWRVMEEEFDHHNEACVEGNLEGERERTSALYKYGLQVFVSLSVTLMFATIQCSPHEPSWDPCV
jgi:hypothetical protein